MRVLPLLLAVACGRAVESPPAEAPPIFTDASAEAGLDFVHTNGMSGELYFAEMMGGGAALFDADGDGDLDLYLVQGRMLPAGRDVAEALFPPRHPQPLTDRLYRNELVPAGELRFTDVTGESGLAAMLADGYGMGVAAGDYDGDGRVDLYVTCFGSNRLLRNDGGSFTDVTREAGVDDERWSVAAAFFDYDRDGRLDLYVGNYVDFTLGTNRACYDAAGARDYCAPSAYRGESDRLFKNRGDGTFEDVSLKAGLGGVRGPGLGAVAADFDGDGWLDLYVGNDGEPNFLWRNRGDGTFEDVALMAGAAVDEDGRPQASMGIDAADFDGDGDEDLFMSHLTGESNALFENLGSSSFRDATAGSGLGSPSLGSTGFGTAFLDYDNDGRLDLLVVNGAVKTIKALASAGDPYPLHQRNQVFHNLGEGRIEDVTDQAGAVFELSEVSRGAAFGDVDDDGDTDVVVVNNNGPARLLVNRVGSSRSWIGLRLVTGERDALGARVEVSVPGRPARWRRAHADGSYASASDPRVLVGLGDFEGEVGVRVFWLDGEVESWTGLEARRYHALRQGTGVQARTSMIDSIPSVHHDAFMGTRPEAALPKFQVEPKACGFRAGLDLRKLNQLLDDLEMEDVSRELTRGAARR